MPDNIAMNLLFIQAGYPWEWYGQRLVGAIKKLATYSASLIDLEGFLRNTPEACQTCQGADILILQYQPDNRLMAAIQHWKAAGKKVILDLEGSELCFQAGTQDDLSKVMEDDPGLKSLKWALATVNGACASSASMAGKLAGYPVIYLPDYVNLSPYLNITASVHPGIRIGWKILPGEEEQLIESGAAQALSRICEHNHQVEIAVFAETLTPRIAVLFDQLEIAPAQKFLFSALSESNWLNHLSNVDLALILSQSHHHHRLAHKHLYELMALKIPWAASDIPAFRELGPYGWLVGDSADAWLRILVDMIEFLPQYRIEAAYDPYLFVITKEISDNIENSLSLIKSLTTI